MSFWVEQGCARSSKTIKMMRASYMVQWPMEEATSGKWETGKLANCKGQEIN